MYFCCCWRKDAYLREASEKMLCVIQISQKTVLGQTCQCMKGTAHLGSGVWPQVLVRDQLHFRGGAVNWGSV